MAMTALKISYLLSLHITGTYLAVEIEEVKGVDAHLDFDLGRIHVLQGGIKNTQRCFNYSSPPDEEKLCKWTRLIRKSLHSTLGLCYNERFDSLPRSSRR